MQALFTVIDFLLLTHCWWF